MRAVRVGAVASSLRRIAGAPPPAASYGKLNAKLIPRTGCLFGSQAAAFNGKTDATTRTWLETNVYGRQIRVERFYYTWPGSSSGTQLLNTQSRKDDLITVWNRGSIPCISVNAENTGAPTWDNVANGTADAGITTIATVIRDAMNQTTVRGARLFVIFQHEADSEGGGDTAPRAGVYITASDRFFDRLRDVEGLRNIVRTFNFTWMRPNGSIARFKPVTWCSSLDKIDWWTHDRYHNVGGITWQSDGYFDAMTDNVQCASYFGPGGAQEGKPWGVLETGCRHEKLITNEPAGATRALWWERIGESIEGFNGKTALPGFKMFQDHFKWNWPTHTVRHGFSSIDTATDVLTLDENPMALVTGSVVVIESEGTLPASTPQVVGGDVYGTGNRYYVEVVSTSPTSQVKLYTDAARTQLVNFTGTSFNSQTHLAWIGTGSDSGASVRYWTERSFFNPSLADDIDMAPLVVASANGAANLALTIPTGGVPAGRRLVLAVSINGGGTTADNAEVLTDPRSNTWTLHTDYENTGSRTQYLLSAHVTTAYVAGDVITVTITNGNTTKHHRAVLVEVQGAETGAPQVGTPTASSSATPTGPSLTTTKRAVLVSTIAYSAALGTLRLVTPTGWTLINHAQVNTTGQVLAVGYRVEDAGTYAMSSTFDVSRSYSGLALAFAEL